MSDATRITPEPQRWMLVGCIELAEKLTSHAAATRDEELIKAAVTVQREAWSALERFDNAPEVPDLLAALQRSLDRRRPDESSDAAR